MGSIDAAFIAICDPSTDTIHSMDKSGNIIPELTSDIFTKNQALANELSAKEWQKAWDIETNFMLNFKSKRIFGNGFLASTILYRINAIIVAETRREAITMLRLHFLSTLEKEDIIGSTHQSIPEISDLIFKNAKYSEVKAFAGKTENDAIHKIEIVATYG